MTTLTMTRHGEARMSQRGIRKSDLEVLLVHGTDIGRDRIMLRKRDAAKLIRDLKKQIATIERLTDKLIVIVDGKLVTTYHQATPIRPSFSGIRQPRTDQSGLPTPARCEDQPTSQRRPAPASGSPTAKLGTGTGTR